LVVVGASAGGVEALAVLVGTLPAGFPAPIVVAQHLDPSRASRLEEILSRSSTLPVRTVEGWTRLEAGVVYVVPASWDVEIADGEITLRETSGRSHPSIDLLFESAARAYGEELFAVILTGTGSDGADGARRVKEHGGTVVIQNPRTARFPGMPSSLAPTTVDIVADLEAIGPLLYDLLTGAYTPPVPDEDRRMRNLLDQLRLRVGIDFSTYRQPTIQRRLQRRMADTGRETLEEYVRYLQRHPEEYQRLANSFLINVTDFFRDPETFDHLRTRIVPELIDDAHARGNELRIWSAGCATGEEAYSLAILVAEALGDDLDDFSVRIFATDLHADSVAFAGRGIYPPAAVENLPPALLERYFTRVEGGYEVRKLIRRLLVFGQHDLARRAPFPRIDLVLCRNVLIYFTPELQRRALQLFAFSLRQGGRLVLGKSESTSPLPEYFAVEDARLKVFRRQGERAAVAPGQVGQAPVDAAVAASAVPRVERAVERLRATRPAPPAGVDRADRLLLDLPVGVVVVDARYDVHAINAAARSLLGVHTAAIGEDFVHLVAPRLPSERLRAAIDRALRGQPSSERYEVRAIDDAGPAPRQLEVSAFPQQRDAGGRAIERVTVIVADVGAARDGDAAARPPAREGLDRAAERLAGLAGTRRGEVAAALREAAEVLRAAAAEVERLGGLVRELESARQELLGANGELTTTNAMLRAENEELLFGNEEAQAAVEEIETLNEEQQATNEELETLNEELQATVEELNTTNEDLEARGAQLEQTGIALEAERSRLAAVLAAMPDCVLVVDGMDRVVLANEAFQRSFGPDGSGLVPEDSQGRLLPPSASPRRRLARGESFTVQFTQPRAADHTRRWYEATGHPIHTPGQDGGGVLVIRDITDRRPRP
jgi:two-component system CheB/CheR fusion protein